MSIVLVVIGLIVAGVVGGKSIIHAAKLRSVVSQVNGYKTAVNLFQLQYDALPGDMRNAKDYWPQCLDFASNKCNGNGDGVIDIVLSSSPEKDESLRAWEHLTLAEMIKGSYILVSNAATFPPTGVFPLSKISGGEYMLVGGGNFMSTYGNTNNRIMLGRTTIGYPTSGLLTSSEAESIDKKIDDGKADSGTIYGTGMASGKCTTNLDSPSDYILGNTDNNCLLLFFLD